MNFEILTPPEFGFDYECLGCEVEGYGNACWFCESAEQLAKMKKLSHSVLVHGLTMEELLGEA